MHLKSIQNITICHFFAFFKQQKSNKKKLILHKNFQSSVDESGNQKQNHRQSMKRCYKINFKFYHQQRTDIKGIHKFSVELWKLWVILQVLSPSLSEHQRAPTLLFCKFCYSLVASMSLPKTALDVMSKCVGRFCWDF